MFIDQYSYEDLVTLKGLEYSGIKHTPGEFLPTCGSIDQLIDGRVNKEVLLKSLSSSLGEEDAIIKGRKNNFFVVYGVIDLINLEYSKKHFDKAPVRTLMW